MPGRTLPHMLQAEVASRNTRGSCYVTAGAKVFDVTSFLGDHPGGGDLILEYGGKDIQSIMGDELSHTHSEAAYEILEEHLVGFIADGSVVDGATKSQRLSEVLAQPLIRTNGIHGLLASGEESESRVVFQTTGLSSAEELSIPTDPQVDYKTHKFLDLSKPLFPQMWFGGFSKDFYLEQVHRPRHYKGGASAPLFGNFLEPFSKTPWWVIPLVWLPPVAYGTYLARQGLSGWQQVFSYWFVGLFLWTLVEYTLHRCLFHIDKYLPDNRVGITGHFLLHGIHHYLPMDKYRLVMPPALFVVLATPFYKLAHAVFYWDWHIATAVFCGGIFGYICYDMTHYFLHHRSLPSYYRELKKYHLQHHYADYENGFGVTSRFWDWVFGTELAPSRVAKAL